MKSAYKFIVASTLFISCFTISAFAENNAAQVTFSGKLIDESCTVQGVSVPFGNVSLEPLKSHGQTTGQIPFQIVLQGCPTAENISIGLQGTTDNDAAETGTVLALTGEGAAKGVGIEVAESDETGSQIKTQMNFSTVNYTAPQQSDGTQPLTFYFNADLKSDPDVTLTAGVINASASINIKYE
ncbi:TPA: fimbrial protein [Citrobacter freundii]